MSKVDWKPKKVERLNPVTNVISGPPEVAKTTGFGKGKKGPPAGPANIITGEAVEKAEVVRTSKGKFRSDVFQTQPVNLITMEPMDAPKKDIPHSTGRFYRELVLDQPHINPVTGVPQKVSQPVARGVVGSLEAEVKNSQSAAVNPLTLESIEPPQRKPSVGAFRREVLSQPHINPMTGQPDNPVPTGVGRNSHGILKAEAMTSGSFDPILGIPRRPPSGGRTMGTLANERAQNRNINPITGQPSYAAVASSASEDSVPPTQSSIIPESQMNLKMNQMNIKA